MKNKIALSILTLIMVIGSLHVNAFDKKNANTMNSGSDFLKLNLTTAYNVKVVQVSFDGNDGGTGLFQITNSDNLVVQQTDEVELIPSPNYFSVDVSEFVSGEYTFIIKTQHNTYSSTITIK